MINLQTTEHIHITNRTDKLRNHIAELF